MFHDEVDIELKSGKGGDGCVSFRREKYIPKGGPDGGDGGKGGDVYLVATRQLSDLNHLASLRHLAAENGIAGSGRKMIGRDGEDLTVEVPVGTQVYRQYGTEWKLVHDFTTENVPKRLLYGGKGGLGNVHFATATHRTPREAQPGEPGQKAIFRLHLELIADVGIIGLPNAGKSTFLSIVSDAKPKIGDYPFTTLSPVLGVVSYGEKRLVMADIPGLIEGASQGKGLGHLFLRHIRRTKMMIHLIDALSDNYARDYRVIRQELHIFDPAMSQKAELVAISKAELITPDIRPEFDQKVAELRNVLEPSSHLFPDGAISAVAHHNIDQLLRQTIELLPKPLDSTDKNRYN